MKRKIAAILASDVADYAQVLSVNADRTLAALAVAKAMFTELITQHEGRVFNAAGDQLLAEFPSAVEALRCALAVQKVLEADHSSPALRFRIGITIGDVVERNGDLLGDGVNIAARLQTLAMPGGICISRSVYEQIGNRIDVGFTNLGPQKLKNMPEPVQAYLVAPGGLRGGRDQRTTGAVNGSLRTWVGAGAIIAVAAAVLIWRVHPGTPGPARPAGDPQPSAKIEAASQPPPRAASPPIAQPTPHRSSAQCRDIMERAQLGQLSAEDRAVLERTCKS